MKYLLPLALLVTSHPTLAHTWAERTDWATALAAQQLSGVVAVCSHPSGKCQTSHRQRVSERYIPASTYKIPHLLIALETGVTPNDDITFKWDGTPQALKPWERDHTYRGLMLDSVVPVFQGFARAIGETRMRDYLQRLDYGNADIAGGIDRFWLDGQLRISAAEQIRFLQRLRTRTLPIAEPHQWRVQSAMLVEATETFVIRGKTGYSLGAPGHGATPGQGDKRAGTGWWVGWIESGTDTHVFACNFDITDDRQLALRKSIPRTLFEHEGWLGQ